jgi:hypothetical protein
MPTAIGPGFWMYETTGVLRPAMQAYLLGERITGEQIAALRAYFRQWIGAPVWDLNPHGDERDREALAELRRRVDELTDRAAIDRWLDDVDRFGLDPL